jgi:hypothetical protein
MPSLAAALRTEIRRHAARESQRILDRLRKQLKGLRLVHREQRQDLAALGRRFARLKARVASRGASAQGRRGPGVPGRPLKPESILKLRTRLGLSRQLFAKLLGVSPGSIFGWEKGRTVPRGASRARISEVRRMGLRAARARAGSASGGRARGPARRGGATVRRRRRTGQA